MDWHYQIGLADGAHGPGDVSLFDVAVCRVLPGPNLPNWQKEAALAEVQSPFDWHGHLIRHVTFSPRYVGDTVAKLLAQGGIVAVAWVDSTANPVKWDRLDPDSVHYWGAGVLKLAEA